MYSVGRIRYRFLSLEMILNRGWGLIMIDSTLGGSNCIDSYRKWLFPGVGGIIKRWIWDRKGCSGRYLIDWFNTKALVGTGERISGFKDEWTTSQEWRYWPRSRGIMEAASLVNSFYQYWFCCLLTFLFYWMDGWNMAPQNNERAHAPLYLRFQLFIASSPSGCIFPKYY